RVSGRAVGFGAVFGGFAMGGGSFSVLVQPNELLVIGGAALGTLIASSPGLFRSRVIGIITKSLSGTTPLKAEYLDLLKLQFELYAFMRKNGAVALDEH